MSASMEDVQRCAHIERCRGTRSIVAIGPGPGFSRGMVPVKHPRCLCPDTLSRMLLPNPISVTPAEVPLYGGLPSLVYSAKTEPHSLQKRFAELGLLLRDTREATVTEMLQLFVKAVLTGQQDLWIASFYEFGLIPAFGEIQWPIVSLHFLLELFPDGQDLKLSELIDRHLTACAAQTGSSLDWELVVQVAILVQCLNAKINQGTGPFDIVAAGERVSRIDAFQLSPSVVHAEQADQVLEDYLYRCERGTIVVATPGCASFPVLDGFVYFKESNENVRKIAYQAKLDKECPKEVMPLFLEAGLLVCGNPSGNLSGKSTEQGCWRYCSERELDCLLGASLRELKPVGWTEHCQEVNVV